MTSVCRVTSQNLGADAHFSFYIMIESVKLICFFPLALVPQKKTPQVIMVKQSLISARRDRLSHLSQVLIRYFLGKSLKRIQSGCTAYADRRRTIACFCMVVQKLCWTFTIRLQASGFRDGLILHRVSIPVCSMSSFLCSSKLVSVSS
jgi:hypothetical protein